MAAPDQHGFESAPVLFVAALFHPLDDFAVERFLNGDVRHRGSRRGAVPVSHAGWEPDDIVWADLLDSGHLRFAPGPPPPVTMSLCPSGWVCQAVPGARLESDGSCPRTGESIWVEQGINANGAIDDFPLIVSRLQLIEDIGADAMDQTNAEAFQEAYKDLVNLLAGGSAQ